MPMRRNLGPVNAPDAHHEWRSFGAWVAGHRRKIAALHDRRPLQIAEVHNFGRRGALLLLLAVNSRGDHRNPNQRCADTSRSIHFHRHLLLWKWGNHLLRKRYSCRGPGAIRGQIWPAQVSNHAVVGLLTHRKHPREAAPAIPGIEYATLGWSSSSSAPGPGLAGIPGPRRQRYALKHRHRVASRYGASPRKAEC